MKKILKYSTIGLATMFLITGCSYKTFSTPVVMSYDGSSVDYSKIDNLKHAKVCQLLSEGNGDNTVVTAAKKAGIKHIKHVDKSFEYEKFLFWGYNYKECVTVYGE